MRVTCATYLNMNANTIEVVRVEASADSRRLRKQRPRSGPWTQHHPTERTQSSLRRHDQL